MKVILTKYNTFFPSQSVGSFIGRHSRICMIFLELRLRWGKTSLFTSFTGVFQFRISIHGYLWQDHFSPIHCFFFTLHLAQRGSSK